MWCGLLLLLPACRQQMADQPSFRPFNKSVFFSDQNSSRPVVKGTVARGQLKLDRHYYKGEKPNTNLQAFAVTVFGIAATNPLSTVSLMPAGDTSAESIPFDTLVAKLHMKGRSAEVWDAVMKRGQERYNIYCSMCHDKVGNGKGMIVQRGYAQPPSLHISRLRNASDGYYFRVITKGFGAMPAYDFMVSTEDRWAIIAYIRALQLSQNADLADVSSVLQIADDADTEKKRIPKTILNRLEKGK